MKKAALISALSLKFQNKQIKIIAELDSVKGKTKQAAKILQNLNLNNSKATLVMPEKLDEIVRSFRNLPQLKLALASQLNTYSALNGGILIFLQSAVEKLATKLGKPTPSSSTKSKPVSSKSNPQAKKSKKTTAQQVKTQKTNKTKK